MPSLIESLTSLVASIFNSILALIQTVVNTILGVFGAFINAIATGVKGLGQTFEGLVRFLFANIVVIGGLVAAFFLYSLYVQRNGRPNTGAAKKIN